jgi:ribosomal protein S18 acetylase RimI-like enzyme
MLALRLAREEDCPALVTLFDMSNKGLTQLGFAALAEGGEDWQAAGARQMARHDVEYSFANTIVAEWDGALAGMMIFLVQPTILPPASIEAIAPADRAFAVLRQQTAGSVYLRNMGVFPEFRGRRIGEALVSAVISSAIRIGIGEVSGIVHETNVLLLAHYAKRGMLEVDRHPVLEHPSYAPDSAWILLKGETNRAMRLAGDEAILAPLQQ